MKRIKHLIAILLMIVFMAACDLPFLQKDEYVVKYYDDKEVVYQYRAEKGSTALNKTIKKEGYKFIGWDINGDGIADNLPVINEATNLFAIFEKIDNYVIYKFVSGEEILDTRQGKIGENLKLPSCDKKPSKEFNFKFIGWDVNGKTYLKDDIFTLTEDVTFKALYESTKRKYTYAIYDDGNKLIENTVYYGTKIAYPTDLPNYKIIDNKYYLLKGYKYENYDIDYIENIESDLVIHTNYSSDNVYALHYDNKLYLGEFTPNQRLNFNEIYNVNKISVSNGYCIKWYIDNNYNNEFSLYNPVDKYVELYGKLEVNKEIDDKILRIDKSIKYVSSYDELLDIFNMLLLNKITDYTVEVKFAFDSLEELLNNICEQSISLRNYRVSCSYINNMLTLNIVYGEQLTKTSKPILTEVKSLNINFKINEKERGADFNNFYIDNVTKTYEVIDSDSLFYVLEHGYKPIIKDANLQKLYDEMRKVLRNIINDDFTDNQKALAIYEWLLTNCIYDKEALDENHNKEYRCYFLEGVFFDHLAVCDGISKAFVALCNIEGIKCVQATGYSAQNGINHAWNKVLLNGYWYIVDPTSGGVTLDNEEISTYYFFAISKDEFASYYIEDGKEFLDIQISDNYNIYNDLSIERNGFKLNTRINNTQEFGNMIKLFKNINEKVTLELYLDYDYSDFSQELQKALSQYGEYINVGYVSFERNGKMVLVLIKNIN